MEYAERASGLGGAMTKPRVGIGTDVLEDPGKRDRAFVYLTYTDALRRAGAIPLLVPPQPENAAEVVACLDGLLMAGGRDCDPALYGQAPVPSLEPMDLRRQENDLALVRAAFAAGVPVLGICLGLQMMNVAAGGSLIQDIESQYDTVIRHASAPENRVRHDVRIEEGTRLSSILGASEMTVNSSHHQAVDGLGNGLRISARAPDGIVEGIEDPSHPFFLGVQWHPEDLGHELPGSALIDAFVEAARRRAALKNAGTVLSPAPLGAAE